MKHISKLQLHCANMTFADKSRYGRLFQKITRKRGESSMDYIKILQNAQACTIDYDTYLPDHWWLKIMKMFENILNLGYIQTLFVHHIIRYLQWTTKARYKNPLNPKASLKWFLIDITPSTLPKSWTSETTFSNYLLVVDAYSKIPIL